MFSTTWARPGRRPAAATTIACALTLAAAGLSAPSAAASTPTTYYVNSCQGSGSDGNAGTSSNHPWASLAKVDATTFHPGDQILFRAGCSWQGTLWPKGSGTASAPITISSYIGATGPSTAPRIQGGGTVPNAVELFDQQYWTVENLDVSNQAPATSTAGANLGDFRGIFVGGDDQRTLSGFTIDHVAVHDVTGVVDWSGGSPANDKPGIDYGTGWDGSKNTGGIVFEAAVADPAHPGLPTILNDMTVENSTIENTSFGGIITKQYAGTDSGAVATGWGTRASATDTGFHPLTNLTIQNNYITQSGTAYGANGMLIRSVAGGVIQNNVVDKVGTCGIETDYSDHVTIQRNEVQHTTVKAGGGDSNAIDTDMGTTNQIVQYNYMHDNNVGALVFQIVFGDSIWRYNMIANNPKMGFQLGSASSATAQIYDNTVYNTAGKLLYLQGNTSHYAFTNNVFYTTVASPGMAGGTGITYKTNYYGGTSPTIPSAETSPVTGAADFADPDVTGPYGTATSGPELSTALGYAPTAGSALINRGTGISGNGGVDYRGRTLYNGAPDVGAVEYY